MRRGMAAALFAGMAERPGAARSACTGRAGGRRPGARGFPPGAAGLRGGAAFHRVERRAGANGGAARDPRHVARAGRDRLHARFAARGGHAQRGARAPGARGARGRGAGRVYRAAGGARLARLRDPRCGSRASAAAFRGARGAGSLGRHGVRQRPQAAGVSAGKTTWLVRGEHRHRFLLAVSPLLCRSPSGRVGLRGGAAARPERSARRHSAGIQASPIRRGWRRSARGWWRRRRFSAPYRPVFYSLGDETGIAELAAFWDFDFSA